MLCRRKGGNFAGVEVAIAADTVGAFTCGAGAGAGLGVAIAVDAIVFDAAVMTEALGMIRVGETAFVRAFELPRSIASSRGASCFSILDVKCALAFFTFRTRKKPAAPAPQNTTRIIIRTIGIRDDCC